VQYLLSTHTQDSSRLDYSADFHYGLHISAVVSGKSSASGICTFFFSAGAIEKLVSAVQRLSTAFIAHTTTLNSKLHPVVNNQNRISVRTERLKGKLCALTLLHLPRLAQHFCTHSAYEVTVNRRKCFYNSTSLCTWEKDLVL
jgi:hypothetical protein